MFENNELIEYHQALSRYLDLRRLWTIALIMWSWGSLHLYEKQKTKSFDSGIGNWDYGWGNQRSGNNA